jgi:RNA polymerase sigma-70 factor (ECF subfamily)
MNDDAALVQQVAAGDRHAFASLYDRYSSRVYGLAIRMLGETMAAEEVTQDAFLKLWSRSTSYDPERGMLLPWLLTIARRTALDRIRLESRRPAIVEPDPDEGWDELPDGNSQGDEARWLSLRFEVASLPVDQRQVIELAYFQGMTHSQIAAELSMPLGTVKTRLRIGMEHLREQWLRGEGGTSRQRSSGVSLSGKVDS